MENRGQQYFAREHQTPLDQYDGTYWLDDVPIYDHKKIKGHAVRAAYLLSGTTDVAAETRDPALLNMLDRVWRNTTERNMYLTGGIGPSAQNEGFTVDYDLPNLTAYQETCASVALAQWNHRLALLYGDARYADVFERALYNGSLAGVALDGTHFFYVNPLASAGNHHRSGWFDCACCPPNEARTLASLGGYAYAVSDDAFWVNLYIQGTATTTLCGQDVTFDVQTDYPWNGKVKLKVQMKNPSKFELRLRVPAWCRGANVSINKRKLPAPATERGYLVLDRTWRSGDVVEIDLPMPVERVAANPHVKADLNQLAIQRGPLVYCLEACDQTAPLDSLYLPANAQLKTEKRDHLLGGVVAITGSAFTTAELDWKRDLYASAVVPARHCLHGHSLLRLGQPPTRRHESLASRCASGTRGAGLAQRAGVGLSFTSANCQPWGINDGLEPRPAMIIPMRSATGGRTKARMNGPNTPGKRPFS